MAKHVILESYSFTPSTRTIVIYGKWIRREQLLLITNVTKNTVIYNFSDPSLGVSAYTTTMSQSGPTTQQNEITTVVVSYDTTSHSATDKLAILVEETYESILPAETLMDPVGKMRTSIPQSLIDTDFEYGQQPTKWEHLALVNNRPTCFYDPASSAAQWTYNVGVASQNTNTVTGTGTTWHGGLVGSRFTYLDGTDVGTITAVTSATSLTVSTSATVASQSYTIFGFPYKGGSTSPSPVADPSIMFKDTTTDATGYTISLLLNTGALGLYVGQPIYVSNSLDQANVDGWWVVDAIVPQASYAAAGAGVNDIVRFKTISITPVTNLFDPTKTTVYPGYWYTGANIPVTSISCTSNIMTVTTPSAHGLFVGEQVHINNTATAACNGSWAIATTPTNTTFTITTPAGGSPGTLTLNGGVNGTLFPRAQGYVIHRAFDGGVQFSNQTPYHGLQMIRQTRRYFRYQSGKAIQFSTGSILKPALTVDTITSSGTTATITTKYPHGITYSSVGTNAQIKVTGASDVAGVAFPGTASQSGTVITGVNTYFTSALTGQTFVFSDGTSAGVITYVSATSLNVTVSQTVSSQKYYVQSTAYNGTFTIASVPSLYTITYTMSSTPTNSTTTAFPIDGYPSGIQVSPWTWYGGKNRVGMFDQQNGFFFEYDGQNVYAVRRSSTMQLPGTFTVTNGSQSVVASSAVGSISSHLKPGDTVVIRGGSYTVGSITSATQMYIYPEYRGATPVNASYAAQAQSNVIVSKTIDTRIPQSAWNIDKCDGTGHSGYNVDLTKMQMFYIDYSWYGAGAIRWGFKNNRGEIIYCHRMNNNNVNNEAYMRSGNMCARYETNTIAPTTWVTNWNAIAAGTGTIYVADATQFPPAGTLVVTAAGGQTGQLIEYMNYSSRTDSTFTISARGQTGGGAAATFSPTTTAPVSVSLYLPSVASTISHWGSSVIMDGRYDDDKSLIFSAGMNVPTPTLSARQQYPLISIRSAPSVDSGLTGSMGAREIVNRMQLILRQMDAFTTGNSFAVDLWLNASIASGYYYNATGTTANSTTLNLTGTLVGSAPVAGSYVWGPGLLPGSFFTTYSSVTSNTLSIAAAATKGGTYWISNNQFQAVGGSSLSQRILHPLTDRLIPGTGEKIFTFFTNSSGVTQQDLSQVRDMATSIVGGASNAYLTPGYANKYPDGPDIITMVATPIGTVSSATIIARLSWSEAQA